MSEQPELRPCPFCGKQPGWFPIEPDYEHGSAYAHVCCVELDGGCGAEMLMTSNEEAIAKWNRRVDDAEIARVCEQIDVLRRCR